MKQSSNLLSKHLIVKSLVLLSLVCVVSAKPIDIKDLCSNYATWSNLLRGFLKYSKDSSSEEDESRDNKKHFPIFFRKSGFHKYSKESSSEEDSTSDSIFDETKDKFQGIINDTLRGKFPIKFGGSGKDSKSDNNDLFPSLFGKRKEKGSGKLSKFWKKSE